MNKILSFTLSIVLSITLVSCGQGVQVSYEMPYTTSAEATIEQECANIKNSFGVDMEYTYGDNVATFTLNESDANKILKQVTESIDFLKEEYTNQGYIVNMEFSSDYKTLTIDFTDTTVDAVINKVYQDFLGLSMTYQCFSGVPASQFSLHVIITCGGQTLLDTIIDKNVMIQA